jgi:integrase/recombinase XerD
MRVKFKTLLLKKFSSSKKNRTRKSKPRQSLLLEKAKAPSRKKKSNPAPGKSLKVKTESASENVLENRIVSQATVFSPDVGLTSKTFISPSEKLRSSLEGFILDQRSENTKRAYGKDLKRFVKFLHVRVFERGVESLDRQIIVAYRDWLQREGLQDTTIDRHLATLRSVFDWLVEDGHLDRNPASKVRFLNPKRLSKTLAFTDEEVTNILAQPNLHKKSGAQHYAILMVLFYCGLRRSELCELKLSQITEEREHKILRLTGKGKVERIIVLRAPVWNAICYHIMISGKSMKQDGYLFSPNKNARSKVFSNPLDSSTIFYIVKKYAELAGIRKKVSPHSCRATAISNARDHNVPDRAIQEFAGWSTPNMITQYDKRRTLIEKSAAHFIDYGSKERYLIPRSLREPNV